MLGIGLLGCGRIGQVHARSIKAMDRARVVAVADAVPDAARSLAENTGAEVRSAEAILSSPDIDAVVIGTPTDTHFDLIHAAAKAGKAVFCEKPVDLSAERIRACIRAVEAAGIPFLTGFQRRFDPHFANLKTRMNAGEIGETEIVLLKSRDPAPPPVDYIKRSGGLFRDMMIHDLDMARHLLGEEPVALHAVGSCLVDPAIGAAGDVDTAAVTLTTAGGKICQITCSRRATYGYDQRIEVHGSKGMLRAGNIHENSVEIATGTGFETAPTQAFFLERYAAAYQAEMEHFVECVNAGTAPTPTIHDGLRAQILADLATQSAQEGRVLEVDPAG